MFATMYVNVLSQLCVEAMSAKTSGLNRAKSKKDESSTDKKNYWN